MQNVYSTVEIMRISPIPDDKQTSNEQLLVLIQVSKDSGSSACFPCRRQGGPGISGLSHMRTADASAGSHLYFVMWENRSCKNSCYTIIVA